MRFEKETYSNGSGEGNFFEDKVDTIQSQLVFLAEEISKLKELITNLIFKTKTVMIPEHILKLIEEKDYSIMIELNPSFENGWVAYIRDIHEEPLFYGLGKTAQQAVDDLDLVKR